MDAPIFVVGNSHAHFFTFSPPGHLGWSAQLASVSVGKDKIIFASCSIGPVTAWSFARKHLTSLLCALESAGAQRGAYILLPVGEVDCRLHLPRQAHVQERSIESVVNECLDRYFKALKVLSLIGYRPIAWGGHPSSRQGNGEDDAYPSYSDACFRNEISRMWSFGLERRCKDHGILFVSILEDLLDETGMPVPGIFQDGCHLAYKEPYLRLAADRIFALLRCNESN